MPMGLYNSPDIFQDKMNELSNRFEYVRAYIDDRFIISDSNFKDHLNKVKYLKNLHAGAFRINIELSFFARDNLEYIGFKITK